MKSSTSRSLHDTTLNFRPTSRISRCCNVPKPCSTPVNLHSLVWSTGEAGTSGRGEAGDRRGGVSRHILDGDARDGPCTGRLHEPQGQQQLPEGGRGRHRAGGAELRQRQRRRRQHREGDWHRGVPDARQVHLPLRTATGRRGRPGAAVARQVTTPGVGVVAIRCHDVQHQ